MGDTVRCILDKKGRQVWSVAPDATVFEALELLAEKDIGAVAVVENGKLLGVMSERDYARKVFLQGYSSKDLKVSEIMSDSPITVAPDDSVEDCMRLMTHHRVRHLPVLDGGKLAGMVSIGDLVNAIISDQADTIQHLNTYITGSYPR